MEDERQQTNRLPALPRLSRNINTPLSSQFLSVLIATNTLRSGVVAIGTKEKSIREQAMCLKSSRVDLMLGSTKSRRH